MQKKFMAGLACLLVASVAQASLIFTVTAGAGNDFTADGWVVATSGSAGEFANGNSTLNGVGGSSLGITDPSWGAFADASGSTFEAVYSLNGGALTAGQTLSIELDNGTVGDSGDSTSQIGIEFRDSGASGSGFSLFFTEGGTFYQTFDNAGVQATTVPLTFDGLTISLTQGSSGQFTADVNSTAVGSGTYGNSSTFVDNVRVFSVEGNFGQASSGEGDLFVNSLSVSAVPEPGTAALMGMSLLTVVALRRRRS